MKYHTFRFPTRNFFKTHKLAEIDYDNSITLVKKVHRGEMTFFFHCALSLKNGILFIEFMWTHNTCRIS